LASSSALLLVCTLRTHYKSSGLTDFTNLKTDYPDSIPAIDDLKICMEKIDMRVYLTESLRSSLEARILHPGVNTMDILTGYVAAIKAIRDEPHRSPYRECFNSSY